MNTVFSILLVVGVFAFIVWQTYGVVKDIKERKKAKEEKNNKEVGE